MEENRIETPLSEVDSNVNAEETVVVNETESNGNTSEEQTVDTNAEQEAQELMNLLSDPNVMRAYRAARRVGERRQVSKKENKKKKAKRRMAKKSKR